MLKLSFRHLCNQSPFCTLTSVSRGELYVQGPNHKKTGTFLDVKEKREGVISECGRGSISMKVKLKL